MSDLIDRQMAIATAVRAAIDWHKLANPQYSIAYCIGEAMRELPSVQPETPLYVTEIESEYKKWVSMSYINKPLAKALYEVWKKHDREDVSRNG